jgi:hypothetical protein
MIWLLAGPALAQTPIVDDVVLEASTTWPNGFGSPSVVWDGSRWRLFAETEVAPPAGCTEAWSVVRANSVDGVRWSTPVLVQGPTTVAPCGARRPSAVWTDAGAFAVVWEAVGLAIPRVGVTQNLLGPRRTRLLTGLDGLEDPALVLHSGVWHVLAVDPALGLVEATSTDLRRFTIVSAPLVATGATPWSAGGVENPTWSCIDDATWPFTLAFGGWDGGDTAWTTGVVRDTGAVYVDSAHDTWATGLAWPAFDVVDDGTNVGVWFETVDGNVGLPAIGLAGVMPVGASVPGRDCTP